MHIIAVGQPLSWADRIFRAAVCAYLGYTADFLYLKGDIMAVKDKKKDKKEKKKKLPLGRTVSNIFFALRQVWETSPGYFIFYYISTMLYAPLDFLSGSFLLRLIVNGVEDGTPREAIITYLAVIASVTLIIHLVNRYYWNVVSAGKYQQIGARLRRKLFVKASEVELSCYETPEFYDKYVKAMDEAFDRVMKVMQTIDNFIWRMVTLLCNSFLIFIIDPVLMVFALLPLLLGFVRKWRNKLKHDHIAARKPVERRQKYVRRTFYLNEYAKEMRIGNMHTHMVGELDRTLKDFCALIRKYGWKRAIADYILEIGVSVVTVLGATLYAVWRALSDGGMTIGDCIVVVESISVISWALSNLVSTFAEFGEHSLFLDDVRFFLDYEPKIKDSENAVPAPTVCADIDLDKVSFRYEGAKEDTLHDISLHIGAGERIALVGQNGSGKTTLVKLLLRLYDPTEGSVKLDGKDIRDYTLGSYRDGYACVFQDFRMFSMSVSDNVLLRNPEEGDTELVDYAIRESGAYDRVSKLDKGVDTTLTREFDDKGANLSVGEQQKIALARAFARKSPIIILDEPSSALDPIAEHTMFDNMMKAAEGRTVLFISHRLSSAVDADRIFLMDGGRITEVGTHRELMEKGGKYAEMFRLLAENYIGKEARV